MEAQNAGIVAAGTADTKVMPVDSCRILSFIENQTMQNKTQLIHKLGDGLVDSFHYLALFGIGATIVWSAVHDYLGMMRSGHANLEDILLLFIYLELGAMVGTYFKTGAISDLYRHHRVITAFSN